MATAGTASTKKKMNTEYTRPVSVYASDRQSIRTVAGLRDISPAEVVRRALVALAAADKVAGAHIHCTQIAEATSAHEATRPTRRVASTPSAQMPDEDDGDDDLFEAIIHSPQPPAGTKVPVQRRSADDILRDAGLDPYKPHGG